MTKRTGSLPTIAFVLASTVIGCRSSTPAPSPTIAASTAATPEMPESAVLAVLEGREWSADAPRVANLGPSAIPALLRIADDERTDRVAYQRVRALLALRHQQTPEVLAFLLAFVGADHDAPRMRAALDTLAVGFGASDRDRVLEACRALENHPDASVRDAAREAEVRARLARAL